MRLPRLRLKVSTLLAWTVVVALVLALIAQQIAADRRERAWRIASIRTQRKYREWAALDQLVTAQVTDILKNASSVELLRVAQPTSGVSGKASDMGVVSATGMNLSPEIALRVGCVLLDHRYYSSTNHMYRLNFSAAEIGLRIKAGSETLDVLIGLGPTSPGSPHQDVWIEIRDEAGQQVHFAGPVCLVAPALQKLAEDLLKK